MIALAGSFFAAAPVAFAAGLVSFLSPCVLPLLPGYLGFLGGVMGQGSAKASRGRAVLGSLSFVLGFTVVFLTFGYLFGGLGQLLRTHHRGLEIIFGSVTVLLGIFFAGWLPLGFLQRERRSHFLPRATLVGAFVLGLLFALGWTPCIGPTLGAIMGLAATSSTSTAWRGTGLAFIYCLGLGAPFVVAAMASEWATGVSGAVRRKGHLIGMVGGIFLIALGVSEIAGWWPTIIHWVQDLLPTTTPPL